MSPVLKLWWQSLRAYSFSMTVLPVVCAFLFARALNEPVLWPLLAPMLISALLLHAGVNVLNDYYDFVLGFDTEEASGSSGVLQSGTVQPRTLLRQGQICLAAACAAGLPLLVVRGGPLAAAALTGLAGAFFYSHPQGYKYRGLGEPLVFLQMGPLLFLSAVYAACGRVPAAAVLPAAAFGCLVTAVLLVNNLRDLAMDRRGGFKTLPMRLGIARTKTLYALLILAAFLALPALPASGRFEPAVLLPVLALPGAVRQVRRVLAAQNPAADLKNAPPQTAALYLLYGLLSAAGLWISG